MKYTLIQNMHIGDIHTHTRQTDRKTQPNMTPDLNTWVYEFMLATVANETYHTHMRISPRSKVRP